MKELIITLSINGGEGDEFSFLFDGDKFARLERVYRDCMNQEGFDNSEFWNWLKQNEVELANDIMQAILEELASSYIFSDVGFHYDLDADDAHPDGCFPLCDLHFDYITADGKKTFRNPYVRRCVIYEDNIFYCDFDGSFD